MDPWLVLKAAVARCTDPDWLIQALVRFFPSVELTICGVDPSCAAGEMSTGSRQTPSAALGPTAATVMVAASKAALRVTFIGSE